MFVELNQIYLATVGYTSTANVCIGPQAISTPELAASAKYVVKESRYPVSKTGEQNLMQWSQINMSRNINLLEYKNVLKFES